MSLLAGTPKASEEAKLADAKNCANGLALQGLSSDGPPRRHRLVRKCQGLRCLGSACRPVSALTGSGNSDIADLQKLEDVETSAKDSTVLRAKWSCPVCLAEVPWGSKRHHIRTSIPVELFKAERPMAIAFS